MSDKPKARPLFDAAIVKRAIIDSFKKLDPQHQIHNPVMFTVLIGSILTTGLLIQALVGGGEAPPGFILQVSLWLWFTVLFANLAEAMAEGRGKAQAETLRKARRDIQAKKLASARRDAPVTPVVSAELRKGDIVLVEASEYIPGDGEVVEGVASVDESAITGESAPVIRESGGVEAHLRLFRLGPLEDAPHLCGARRRPGVGQRDVPHPYGAQAADHDEQPLLAPLCARRPPGGHGKVEDKGHVVLLDPRDQLLYPMPGLGFRGHARPRLEFCSACRSARALLHHPGQWPGFLRMAPHGAVVCIGFRQEAVPFPRPPPHNPPKSSCNLLPNNPQTSTDSARMEIQLQTPAWRWIPCKRVHILLQDAFLL